MSGLHDEYRQHMAGFRPAAEELPGDLAWLAETIDKIAPGMGVRIAVHLAENASGTELYIHNIRLLRQAHRNRWIVSKCLEAGVTARDVARAVGEIGSRQVKEIWEKGER